MITESVKLVYETSDGETITERLGADSLRLLAAAPKLLEACKALLLPPSVQESHDERCRIYPCPRCRAQDAIAEAEGLT